GPRLGLGDVRLRPRQGRTVRLLVDHKQQVSLLDLRPLREVNLLQMSPAPGPYLHRLDCCRPAGKVREVGDRLLQRITDGNDGRGEFDPFGGRLRTARQAKNGTQGQQREKEQGPSHKHLLTAMPGVCDLTKDHQTKWVLTHQSVKKRVSSRTGPAPGGCS